MGLPPEKLIVTVFEDDDEAEAIWINDIGLPKERVLRLGEKDNFWSMGETGPCGPCSEIHYDRGSAYACDNQACGPDCDCDRWLEIWNLVFMQYDRDGDGNLTPLPKPSVDTGMGLERLVSVIQQVETNFETDLILPIIRAMEKLTPLQYGADAATDISFRVIGDHLRAAVFLIADDVHPSNEGRGYVLRRIIRRALRHGRNLEVTDPFAHKLTGAVIETMRDGYPELADYGDIVDKVILGEERSFGTTLDFGMKLINEMIDEAKKRGDNIISGTDAFRLYDTYGFPGDLACDIAEDAGVSLDSAGFEKEMAAQQEKARQSWKGAEATGAQLDVQGVAETDFTGYEQTEATARILALYQNETKTESASAGEKVSLILDSTPFYAESGGQVADTGVISAPGFRCEVTNVKKSGNHFLHHVTITNGSITEGQTVTAKESHGTGGGGIVDAHFFCCDGGVAHDLVVDKCLDGCQFFSGGVSEMGVVEPQFFGTYLRPLLFYMRAE